jgi:hypothetical protein
VWKIVSEIKQEREQDDNVRIAISEVAGALMEANRFVVLHSLRV